MIKLKLFTITIIITHLFYLCKIDFQMVAELAIIIVDWLTNINDSLSAQNYHLLVLVIARLF